MEGRQFSVSRRLKLSDNRIKFSNILCAGKRLLTDQFEFRYFCDLGEYFIFGDKMAAQFQSALADVCVCDRNGQTFGIKFGS